MAMQLGQLTDIAMEKIFKKNFGSLGRLGPKSRLFYNLFHKP